MVIKKDDWRSYDCIAQTQKSDRVSDRYSFIPSTRPLETLIKAGWFVHSVRENMVTKADNSGFQKHVVRLRRKKDLDKEFDVGDIVPGIAMANAHNGSAMFEIMGALDVCICSNQMLVSDSLIGSHKIKHVGYTDDLVHEAVDHIVERVPLMAKRVKEFRAIELSDKEKVNYAKKALQLMYTENRWEKEYLLEKSAQNALVSLRPQEDVPTLWNVYNILQEKLIKGDRFLVPREKPSQIMKTREVKKVDRDIFINKGLWELAEQVANKKMKVKVKAKA